MAQLTPRPVLNAAVPALLAADPATLAPPALANHVHLIVTAINPITYDFNPVNEATFTGSAAKLVGVGTQVSYLDPITSEWVIILKEPVGGWTWTCTVTPGAPETVTALCVTDNADAVTLGSCLLTQGPTTITNAGDGVTEGDIEIRFNVGFMS